MLRNETNAILVDAGSINTPFAEISDALKSCLGDVKINGIILTHLDSDHTNFVGSIVGMKDHIAEDFCIYLTQSEEDHGFHPWMN